MSSSYAGAMLGSFLHPDVCQDRRTAIACTVLAAILADLQGMIVLAKPALRYVLWILPNAALVATQYGNEAYFKIKVSVSYFCILMIYALIYGILGSFLQYKKRA